jgi:hypothetical protein
MAGVAGGAMGIAMIRGFVRVIGLLLLAAAFVFLVYDGARSIADQAVRLTRSAELWNDLHQASQQALRTRIEEISPALWTNGVRLLLDQPVWAVIGIIAIVLLLASRPRQPLIGYSR